MNKYIFIAPDLIQPISDETLNQLEFQVDFNGHYLFQIEKKDGNYKITNAMNGWGDNCMDEFNRTVVILAPTTPSPDVAGSDAVDAKDVKHGHYSYNDLRNLLEDVVNVLDLSETAIEKHGPLGTEPSVLVREVLEQKNKEINYLKSGLIAISDRPGGQHPQPAGAFDVTPYTAEAYQQGYIAGVEAITQHPRPAGASVEQAFPNDYVAGFLFDSKAEEVVLIWKEKPAWQKGKLNGIGGKIENGETSKSAMVREFKEETGLDISDWSELITVSGEDWRVQFFYAVSDSLHYAKTMEAEEVAIITVADLYTNFEHIANLDWLIPMAQNRILSPDENIYTGAAFQAAQPVPRRPHHDEWVKEMMKWSKKELIEFINKILDENERAQERPDVKELVEALEVIANRGYTGASYIAQTALAGFKRK